MHNNLWLVIVIVLPLLGAVFAYAGGRKKASLALWSMLGVSVLEFGMLSALLWQTAHGETISFSTTSLCVTGLVFYADGFRALYAWIAALLWGIASVFSFSYFAKDAHVPRYAFFTLLTLSAVIGVFVSDQLLTTILFFEVMSLASYPWVAHTETPEAVHAAQSYLWIAVIGGLCMLMGLLLLPQPVLAARYSAGALVAAQTASESLMLPAVLLLIGFGAKAGAFPLHIWLPKAYPAAPAPASALLSAVLSKAGIFGVLLLSGKLMAGVTVWHGLIFWIGSLTMLIGGVFALLSAEMRQILAWSSMSQIGFVCIGVGLYGLLGHHNGAAVQGLVMHMVNHSLLKMILFLCAGGIVLRLGNTNLNRVQGYGKGKPLLHFVFLSAMAGLAGIPLGAGFVSKTLLHEGLLEYIQLAPAATGLYQAAEWLFVLSGGLTLAYMLKLYVCLFWERARTSFPQPAKYITRVSGCMLAGMAAMVWVLGCFPAVFLGRTAELSAGFLQAAVPAEVSVYQAEPLLEAMKSVTTGLFLYFAVVRVLLRRQTEQGKVYVNPVPIGWSLENKVYRPLLKGMAGLVFAFSWVVSALPDVVISGIRSWLLHVRSWRVPMPGGNRFTYGLGGILNGMQLILNKTIRKKNPVTFDFTCALAASNQEFNRSFKRLKRSLSYSLLLFCIGLFALLTYLVLRLPGA